MDIFDFKKYITDHSIRSVCICSGDQSFAQDGIFTGIRFILEFNEFVFLSRLNTIILKNGCSSVVFENILSVETVQDISAYEHKLNITCRNSNVIKPYTILCKQ